MAHWTCTISLKQQPHCPVCGAVLQQVATVFVNGVAVCSRCRPNTGSEFTLYNPLVHDKRLQAYWTVAKGLLFYQPPGDPAPPLNRLWHLIAENPAKHPWHSPADKMTIRAKKDIGDHACWMCRVEPVGSQGAFCRTCCNLRDRYAP